MTAAASHLRLVRDEPTAPHLPGVSGAVADAVAGFDDLAASIAVLDAAGRWWGWLAGGWVLLEPYDLPRRVHDALTAGADCVVEIAADRIEAQPADLYAIKTAVYRRADPIPPEGEPAHPTD